MHLSVSARHPAAAERPFFVTKNVMCNCLRQRGREKERERERERIQRALQKDVNDIKSMDNVITPGGFQSTFRSRP